MSRVEMTCSNCTKCSASGRETLPSACRSLFYQDHTEAMSMIVTSPAANFIHSHQHLAGVRESLNINLPTSRLHNSVVACLGSHTLDNLIFFWLCCSKA